MLDLYKENRMEHQHEPGYAAKISTSFLAKLIFNFNYNLVER